MSGFEPQQIVIAHGPLWDALQSWAEKRHLRLVPMPSGEDDLPTWFFAPADL